MRGKKLLLAVLPFLVLAAAAAVVLSQMMNKDTECPEGVSVAVKSIDDDGITYTLVNNTDSFLGFGKSFTIEKKTWLGWRRANITSDMHNYFTLELFMLEPCEEREESHHHGYGMLKKGTYRLRKDVDLRDSPFSEALADYTLYGEFEIT